ncbi:hypothetical protein DFH11DRAFT_1745929 [Phellopilus nigrolimitatus]|nr:hypothetical protein DFH11DRAFT_1745929 [Phellopilus nigrolimitatus]
MAAHERCPAAAVSLPAELYYPIFSHVASRRSLRTLAATARILQRPAEAALYRAVTLDSRSDVRAFCGALARCPRFAPLVRSLTLDWPLPEAETGRGGDGDEAAFWARAARVGPRRAAPAPAARAALRVRPRRRAAVVPRDAGRAHGARVDRRAHRAAARPAAQQRRAPAPDADADPDADPDAPLIAACRALVPASALPRLHILHAESLALARALVPGRPVTHLWVPGASFAAAYTSDFTYPALSPAPAVLVSSAGPRPDTNDGDEARAAHLCGALRDFGRGAGPVRALRMALDLPRPALARVLACAAHELRALRTLGFLSAGALEPAPGAKEAGPGAPPPPAFPHFAHLHTLCLWSTPSLRAVRGVSVSASAGAGAPLPALRTLACLHFSPAFEWLCLPVNDELAEIGGAPGGGGVRWERERERERVGEDGRMVVCGRRRATAVHDPGNLLWRDA